MKDSAIMIELYGEQVEVKFILLGPSLGWGVHIGETRPLRYVKEGGRWVPKYFKMAGWLNADELDAIGEYIEISASEWRTK